MFLSDSAQNAMLDAFETAVGTAPYLRAYDGVPPADETTALSSNTLLAEGILPSDWMATAATHAKAKNGTWTMTGQSGAGAGINARFGRLYASNGTTCHGQFLISEAWAVSTAYILGQQVNLGGNVYVVTTAGTSASSGGPAGTGTGISDGTVTWAYVGLAEMILDNSNIANAQVVSVSAFTLTGTN